MTSPFPPSGLYAITDSIYRSGTCLVTAVAQAIEGGARVIQYREKQNKPDLRLTQELLNLCRSRRIPFIINDNIELASLIGADGVHLGRRDQTLTEARSALGDQSIVGLSCYDSIARATQAEQNGADYIAFGCFFPSPTKPNAQAVEIDILKQTSLKIPVVAIGGITPQNGNDLLEAGADLLAVISGIFAHPNPARAAARYKALFEKRQSITNPRIFES